MAESPQQYKFHSFFLAHPLQALELAQSDEQLHDNETILKYVGQFKQTGFHIFTSMALQIFFIRGATMLAHYRRSLALSGPRNWFTFSLKYAIVPGLMTYWWERGRYQEMMAGTTDLRDPEIEDRYREILEAREAAQRRGK